MTGNRHRLTTGLAIPLVLLVLLGACGSDSGDTSNTTNPTQTTTPTSVTNTSAPVSTISPDAQIQADLETIKAAVAAFYSGDAERAADLFELTDRTDQEIRDESAYQAAIGGRLTLNCRRAGEGTFTCLVPYHNAMTDAVGHTDGGDSIQVNVKDGAVTKFAFPEHSWMVLSMGAFLALEGRFDGYGDCGFGPFAASCATIQLENVDEWAEWRKTAHDPWDVVEVALESWYRGDCEEALFLSISDHFGDASDCASGPSGSLAVGMVEYERLLGADISFVQCASIGNNVDDVTCAFHYSNALNRAVDKPGALVERDFSVQLDAFITALGGDEAWYQVNYPEDSELSLSFKQFAEEGDLKEEYGQACAARTQQCANLILENIDGWADWYKTNA